MRRYAQQLREQKLMKVGVNVFQVPAEQDTLLKDVAERKFEPCFGRIEQIRQYKRRRDQVHLRDALAAVYGKARAEGENLMEPYIAAVAAGATMGEIGGVLRMAYGTPYDPFGLVEPPFRF
jgi:methylmalonyl-CoA mutase, N-terminal domain